MELQVTTHTLQTTNSLFYRK